MNHRNLVLATTSEIEAIRYLQTCGILRTAWECMRQCGTAISIVQVKEGHYFRCPVCWERKSIRTGTWLAKSRLGFVQVLDFLYYWASDSTHRVIRRETGIGSSATTTDWARYCREVCMNALCNDQDTVIGGEGHIVEIDESLFAKRKYNVGRAVKSGWVFGGLERGSRRCFFEFVPDRSERTLVEVIQRRVAPRTTIHSDQWRSYSNLSAYGYSHQTVNHSQNFVDPVTGTHTQSIESEWSQLKQFLRGCGRNIAPHTSEYIGEFVYRRAHAEGMFEQLLVDIAEQCRPK